MSYHRSAFGMLIAFGAMAAAGHAAEGRLGGQGERHVEMVIGTSKDGVVRAECIKTRDGATVGFRVEVINPSADERLVLAVRDDHKL